MKKGTEMNVVSDQKIHDLIILGAGCAGLSAGIYAGRAALDTLIIERQQAGGQALTTDEIANYPGFESITGAELSMRLKEQAEHFGAQIISGDVTRVQLADPIKQVHCGQDIYRAHTVIIATGATPKPLGFEGEDTYRGRGVSYCATCDGFFFRGKEVFVIGGGYSAAQEALFLTRFAKQVNIIVRKDHFACAKSLADQVMHHEKIKVHFHTRLVRAFGEENMQGAMFENNQTGELWEYRVLPEDGVFGIFVFVGYQPTSALVSGQVQMDEKGYILADEHMATDIPGVYVAGDVRQKPLRQLVSAAADGAIAAVSAEHYLTGQAK